MRRMPQMRDKQWDAAMLHAAALRLIELTDESEGEDYVAITESLQVRTYATIEDALRRWLEDGLLMWTRGFGADSKLSLAEKVVMVTKIATEGREKLEEARRDGQQEEDEWAEHDDFE